MKNALAGRGGSSFDAPEGVSFVEIDRDRFDATAEPVDLVFDTIGGDVLARSAAVVRPGGGRLPGRSGGSRGHPAASAQARQRKGR